MRRTIIFASVVVFVVFLVFFVVPKLLAQDSENPNKAVKEYFDGKTFVVVKPGLMAGEYQKQTLGPGQAGLLLFHFDDNINPVPEKVKAKGDFVSTDLSRFQRLDDRTFVELKSGLNITKLEKGEQVRIRKFYTYVRDNNNGNYGFVELWLEPLDPSHLQDLDVQKASKKSFTAFSRNGSSTNTTVAGFGLRCIFIFPVEISQAANPKAIFDEIGEYLLPISEMAKLEEKEKNIEVNVGMSEEEVIKNLGQPTKTIKVGNEKVLKYPDLTLTMKEGVVADVKVN